MYSSTVSNISVLGIDYLETTIFFDGVIISRINEPLDKIEKFKQQQIFTFLKSFADNKLSALNNI